MAYPLIAIVLAAGKGSRMKSELPKPLHTIAGLPMVSHVLNSVAELEPETIRVVVSSTDCKIAKHVATDKPDADLVVQSRAGGTGDAAYQAVKDIDSTEKTILILCGDVPLITSRTLGSFVTNHQISGASVSVMAFHSDIPNEYGRLITNADDQLVSIREASDATDSELEIQTCNSGIIAIQGNVAEELLGNLEFCSRANETRLTDVVVDAVERGWLVDYMLCEAEEVTGANDRQGLAMLEEIMQKRLRIRAMEAGVSFIDPNSVFLSWDTTIEKDVTIEPNVFIGSNVHIGEGAIVRAFSHIEGANIGQLAIVGPFARLRPGSEIKSKAKIGNFVEVKNSDIGEGAKLSHLSYVGDTTVGESANLGAGTITCNYNGFEKSRTKIGANAFIGSNTSLIAPVSVGQYAMVAAGSTITSDVPDQSLAITRPKQKLFENGALRYRSKYTKTQSAA